MGIRFVHRLWIIRPTGGEGGISSLLEQRGPAIPAARQEPEAVDEDHRLSTGQVGALDLLGLVLGDGRRRRLRSGSIVHGVLREGNWGGIAFSADLPREAWPARGARAGPRSSNTS